MSLSSEQTRSHNQQPLDLTPTEERLYPKLFFQAQDAASPVPILGDPYAQQHINKLRTADYSRNVFTTEPRTVESFVARIKLHDMWAQRFLDSHARAGIPVTVLNVGCGLDSRNLRVSRGASVRWIDVDEPDVMEMRRSAMAEPPGDYHAISAGMIAAANAAAEGKGDGAVDLSWIDALPTDRPTYIMAEEQLMWWRPAGGRALVAKLVAHFAPVGGQFATDMLGRVVKELAWLMPVMKGSNLKIRWAINNPRELETLGGGQSEAASIKSGRSVGQRKSLRLVHTVKWYELLGASQMKNDGGDSLPVFGKWTGLASHIPGFKNIMQMALFDMGLDVAEMSLRPPGSSLSRRTTDCGSSFMTEGRAGSTMTGEGTDWSGRSILTEGSTQWSGDGTESSYTGVSHKGSVNALGNPQSRGRMM